MEELPRLYAAQDEGDVGTGVRQRLLLSAHHYLAEVGIDYGGAESLELSNQLHEQLLHELVDHSAKGRLIQ